MALHTIFYASINRKISMNFKTPLPQHFDLPVIKTAPEHAFDSLAKQIKKFEGQTSEQEVVAAMLASFGQSVTLHIHRIRLSGQMICMEGITDSGSPATLVQHYTQASILLLKVPKAPQEEKRPIGF
jgi:hydroxypyruvate isomerase